VRQVRPPAFLVLRDRVAALLDHLLDHPDHLHIVELDALVHLALLDRSGEQAQRAEPLRLARFHRGLDLVDDAGLQRHRDAPSGGNRNADEDCSSARLTTDGWQLAA
jgi:hypothetical protein